MALLKYKKFANFFGLVDEEYEDDIQEDQQSGKTATATAEPLQTKSNTDLQQVVNEPSRETRFSENIQRALKDSHQRQTDRAQQMQQDSSKVISINKENRSSGSKRSANNAAHGVGKISIVEPRVYSEAMTIAKRILAGESVLVNFDLIDESQARRIVDFLTGTVYAVDGDIQRVGDEIFLCTPADVEIDVTVAQSLAESNFFD